MTTFKFRSKITGQFSYRGMWARFGPVGDYYDSESNARRHLNQYRTMLKCGEADYHGRKAKDYLDQLELVEFELVEKTSKDI
jgi:hypothetical protein